MTATDTDNAVTVGEDAGLFDVGIVQLNPTVGDVAANTAALEAAYRDAVRAGADLVVAGELAVCGYPPEDLLDRDDFIDACTAAIENLAAATGDVPFIFGAPRRITPTRHLDARARRLANSAIVAQDGEIVACVDKTLLANHAIFDEGRHFHPAESNASVEVTIAGHRRRLGVLICEDLWAPLEDPDHDDRSVAGLHALRGADALIALNASPWWLGKHHERVAVAASVARRYRLPLVYVNQWGGQDGIVFDGRSFLLDAAGTIAAACPAFTDAVAISTVGGTARVDSDDLAVDDTAADMWAALCVGVTDYVTKGGHPQVIIGLSGGIDSAVTAAVCVDALGPDRVRGVAMPGPHSSDSSISDAAELAARLGIRFDIAPIGDTYTAAVTLLDRDVLDEAAHGVTVENLQARIRGMTLMAVTNATGGIVASTGNKSETAVGYTTLYGDMAGGLAVLSDIYKTDIYRLARWRNTLGPGPGPIPDHTITRPPSAELADDQRDTDSLGDYDVLDPVLAGYIDDDADIDTIVARTGVDRDYVALIVSLVDRAEHKRRQAPPGIKVTARAFGRDRRRPITNRWNPTSVAATATTRTVEP